MEFIELLGDHPAQNYENEMILDCANGVGALPMDMIANRIRSSIDIQLVNTATDNPEILNEGCGAEFVHKEVKHPSNVD